MRCTSGTRWRCMGTSRLSALRSSTRASCATTLSFASPFRPPRLQRSRRQSWRPRKRLLRLRLLVLLLDPVMALALALQLELELVVQVAALLLHRSLCLASGPSQPGKACPAASRGLLLRGEMAKDQGQGCH